MTQTVVTTVGEHADGDDVRRWHSAEHVTFPVYVSEGQG